MVEKRVYFFVHWSMALFLIILALLPVPSSLISWIQSQASNWQNIQFLQMTFLFAGIGIGIQTYVNQFQNRFDAISFPNHILVSVLIIYVSVAVVILGKYLFGIMPDLDPGQLSFLYTILSESPIDLFSEENLYQPPFLAPIYGPLYYAASKLLMKIIGESIFALRLMTIFSVFGICVALKIMAQKSSSGSLSWVTPGLFLATFPLVVWIGPPTKPEYFAALFSICGLLVYYLLGYTNNNRWWVVVSGILFLAALLIKFTILVGLAATLAHLLLRRKFQEFVGLLLLSVGLFLVSYFWINNETGGGLLVLNVLGNSAQPQIWKIITVGVLGYLNHPFTIIASAAVVIVLIQSKTYKEFAGLVGFAFFASLALFIVSLGRPGSSATYYLEGIIFGSLAIGLVVASGEATPHGKGLHWIVIFYLVLALPTRAAFISQSYGDFDEEEFVISQIRSLDVQEDEFILSDVQYTYAVYRAGRSPLIMDNFYYTLLAENGLIDSAIPFAFVKNGKVPYLALHMTLDEHASLSYGGRYFTKELISYLMQNYQCETVIERWDGSLFVLCKQIQPDP